MALGKRKVPLFLSLFILPLMAAFMLSLLQVESVNAAAAAGNRSARNSAETGTYNQCASEGWQARRYGAIWVADGSYYNYQVNVGANDTTTGVFIAGSVYGCHHTGTNNTYAVNVAPQGGNGWRLTGLSSRSLFRGQSQNQHNWSTQGGQITANLNVSGLATNNSGRVDSQTIYIDLYRCFSTNSSSPTGTCEVETVPITVVRAARPVVNVQIHVFKTRTDTPNSYTNVQAATTAGSCGNPNSYMVTDASGYASRTMDSGVGLCLRLTNAAPAVAQYETIAGPYVRPWGSGYGPGCGNYAGNSNYTQHCGSATYECQRVGVYDASTCGNSNVDRTTDTGYDFVYVVTPAPLPSCSISASPNPINEGENTTISWSSSYGVNMTVTGDGNSWSGTSGSRTTTPSGPGTRTYTGTVSNSSGSRTCSTTVTIIPIPTCTISVSPSSYVGGGGNTTSIEWRSYNASSMTVRRGGTTISNALNGSYTDNQQTPGGYTYSGTVSIVGAGSRVLTNSCSANLTVYTPPGCTASPTFAIPGETVTYTHSGNAPNPPYQITWSSGATGPTYSTTYGSAGTYTVTVTQGNVTNSCTAYVVNKPYARVYAGDTLAGVGFGDADGNCPAGSVVDGKRQLGFTYNAGGNYAGGGNSHANIGTANIVEFIAGTLESGPSNPRILALENTSGSLYGGDFNMAHLGQACAIDYYSKLPAGAANVASGSASVSSLGNGNHRYSGNFVLNAGSVGPGNHVTFYVDGNVFISGNINYAGAGGYGSDPKNIPSFKLVVRGNIYVDASVSELNGMYIAQPNGGSGGTFYTCGFNRGGGNFTGPTLTSGTGGMGNPYISSEYMGACSTTQLTVYGAVAARDVRLLRSRGTVGTSVEGYPSPGAAERFILTPDTWFNGDPSKSKPFQSYSALPPIL